MTNQERDLTTSTRKIRPVRYFYSPTGPIHSGNSVAHQALLIGVPGGEDEMLKSELLRFRSRVRHETKPIPKDGVRSLEVEQLNKLPIRGYTRMSNEEIGQHADQYISENPIYDLSSHNCRHFAEYLAESIIDEVIKEPDRNAQYSFTTQGVKFVRPFQIHKKDEDPDWILPGPNKVLVNVTEVDEDTWRGQVEGTEDWGKFDRLFVERL